MSAPSSVTAAALTAASNTPSATGAPVTPSSTGAPASSPAGTAEALGLTVTAEARRPEPGDGAPPEVPGFVVSPFSPLVVAAAQRCLARAHGAPPVAAPRGERTGIVLVSVEGDRTTAEHVAALVDAGDRVGPLLFFQSVPNAVAGWLAGRWGLGGPVACRCPVGDPVTDGLAYAALLIADGDADEVLVVVVETAAASAVLVRGEPR